MQPPFPCCVREIDSTPAQRQECRVNLNSRLVLLRTAHGWRKTVDVKNCASIRILILPSHPLTIFAVRSLAFFDTALDSLVLFT